jgi:hypothetical protein
MFFYNNLTLKLASTQSPLHILKSVLRDLQMHAEIEVASNTTYSWCSVFLYDRELGLSARVDPHWREFGLENAIISSGLDTNATEWIDFDFSISDYKKLDEMSLNVLQIVGTIMRLFEGDCILLNEVMESLGLIRRMGQVLVDNSQWHWTKEEVDHLGIPYTFDRILGEAAYPTG